MNSTHDLLAQVRDRGAGLYAATDLASDHSAVTRRVRRDRTVRTSLFSLAAVVAVGVAALATADRGGETAPISTPRPSPSVSAPVDSAVIDVGRDGTFTDVVEQVAAEFEVTVDEAEAALIDALPPEAQGDPEGWLKPGQFVFAADAPMPRVLEELVGYQVSVLEANGVARNEWRDTIILASLIGAETTSSNDHPYVARVLLNRLNSDMNLQLESAYSYGLLKAGGIAGHVDHDLDSPYNTFRTAGLPGGAIGVATPEAIEAAVNPADGDWLFYYVWSDGDLVLSTNYPDHLAAVEADREGQS